MRNKILVIGLIAGVALMFSACHKKINENTPAEKIDSSKGTYFSLRQFTADQLHTYHGYPFSFVRTTTVNGVKDSDVESINTVDWGYILKTFFEADIGQYKYLGKYKFTLFEDDLTATRNFLYEAKDPELFTQKLMISADQLNNKIRSIYIETQKRSSYTEETQKLLYNPEKVIQIQHFEKSALGKAKDIVVEYRFM